MTSIIIPYAPSHSGNTELKYCLRSIEKHLKGCGEIYVIGADPKIEGVIHIPAEDAPEYSRKERNVFNKLLLAASMPEVSDPFLVVHDDHYLLEDVQAGKFPNYYAKDFNGVGLYGNTVANTKELFKGKSILNYDVHCPMLMQKDLFPMLTHLDWSKKFGYCIKSVYGYVLKGSILTTDLKIRDPALTKEKIKSLLQGRKWFSVGDHVFRAEGMKEVMEELYPAKEQITDIKVGYETDF